MTSLSITQVRDDVNAFVCRELGANASRVTVGKIGRSKRFRRSELETRTVTLVNHSGKNAGVKVLWFAAPSAAGARPERCGFLEPGLRGRKMLPTRDAIKYLRVV